MQLFVLEFAKILKKEKLLKRELRNQRTLFKFKNFMKTLAFCFEYVIKIDSLSPHYERRKEEEIIETILFLLLLLVWMPKMEAELLFLRNQVRMYVKVYQDEGSNIF